MEQRAEQEENTDDQGRNPREKVKGVVAEKLNVGEDQVTPEAKFVEDLGADSLELVELVMAIEDEFDVKNP